VVEILEYPNSGDRSCFMPVKLVLVVITILCLLLLENKFPFFSFQNSLRSRISNNFELGAVNSIASSLFTLWLSQSQLLGTNDRGLIATIPVPVIAGICSFLILDLYMYVWHRAMHRLSLGWNFHRLHHTDRTMNVSTAYRFHPIEIISSSIPKLGLIWVLGISGNFVAIYELVFTVVVVLHHSNFRLPESLDRLLAHALVTPHYHRIHHSQIVTETNSNYGSVLLWWDRLFGTYRDRSDLHNIELGLSDETGDLNILQSILLPMPHRGSD
jgi:sterol desaturase/sphingolipid hydroxylase (fatty acid hydroxylase superfamily)